MLMTKRGGDDLTRGSDGNKRASCGEEATESLISGGLHWDANQCVWSETIKEVALNLSRTVVSLALSDGHKVLFECSGMAIESVGSSLGSSTCFLTSASLVRALDDKTKDHDDLKIEVHYGGNVFTGSLQEYDLDHDIALVMVMTFLNVHGIPLDDVQFPPHTKVVAVGREISGKLMATSGILTGDSSGSEDSEELMLSTCKIPEADHLLILMGTLLA